MITIAAIKGMLNPILESNVNYVNAPSLAKERNIKITEIKDKAVENFANLITISITSSGKTETIQGTLFGEEGRIVSINSYRVDVDPHARILICPHINRPGVIGTIGSLLGYANINISGMQVGKTKIAGTSMMVLTIDNEIPDTVMQQIINLDGIFDAKLVNYYTV
jgi:D-3-phosphoglycerate dehydrogenase